jgi:hypothetical protein
MPNEALARKIYSLQNKIVRELNKEALNKPAF